MKEREVMMRVVLSLERQRLMIFSESTKGRRSAGPELVVTVLISGMGMALLSVFWDLVMQCTLRYAIMTCICSNPRVIFGVDNRPAAVQCTI